MPAKSKAQFRFMKAVEEGKIVKKGLPPGVAKEFTENETKERFATLKDHLRKKK